MGSRTPEVARRVRSATEYPGIQYQTISTITGYSLNSQMTRHQVSVLKQMHMSTSL